MHIQHILNEDFNVSSTTPSIRFNDLNTLQVRTLLRIANGDVDVESASEAEYDVMADLSDMGLLDNEYDLNERGQKAVAIANKLGGSAEVVQARQRQSKLNSPEGIAKLDKEADELAGDSIDAGGNIMARAESARRDADDEFDFAM